MLLRSRVPGPSWRGSELRFPFEDQLVSAPRVIQNSDGIVANSSAPTKTFSFGLPLKTFKATTSTKAPICSRPLPPRVGQVSAPDRRPCQ